MVSAMRSWLGWENPRITCTLQLPGGDSEKRPEGFDKPQFYPATGVAVQRCEQRARSRSRSEWGASDRESAPAGDVRHCIPEIACKEPAFTAARELLNYLQRRTPFAPTRYQRKVESHPNRPRIDLAHHLSIDFQLRAITLLLTIQECFRVGAFMAR